MLPLHALSTEKFVKVLNFKLIKFRVIKILELTYERKMKEAFPK